MSGLGINLKRIIERILQPWKIARKYENDLKGILYRVDDLHKRMGEHTVVHADIHYRRADQIIVIGRYRNHDYVRVFNVDTKTFGELIEYLKRIEPQAAIGRWDLPCMNDVSIVYPRRTL